MLSKYGDFSFFFFKIWPLCFNKPKTGWTLKPTKPLNWKQTFNERKDHFRRSEEFDLINSINRSCSMKADKANLKLRVKFL